MQILKDNTERLGVIDEQMEELTTEYDALEEVLEKSSGHGKIVVYDVELCRELLVLLLQFIHLICLNLRDFLRLWGGSS